MTIKSDKWIRRMAEQTGMIEPFEPGQVREANGHKIVSYGTSSYGMTYVVRMNLKFLRTSTAPLLILKISMKILSLM